MRGIKVHFFYLYIQRMAAKYYMSRIEKTINYGVHVNTPISYDNYDAFMLFRVDPM